ncbi:MAG: MFS transporter [Planctomycetaceae bacterium]|nr:MFS transporter [Planctomycetaceae bacterium]
MDQTSPELQDNQTPWYQLLSRYHWLVFIVCSLGWAFDCMDQHLFTYSRAKAIGELMSIDTASDTASNYAALATSIMIIGWATGGIIFGIIGDKFGRARTMVYTILIYSLLTGLSGFSYTIWDFMLIRFLAGIGIGGQFAVGASLLAETMPAPARPYVLGIMQVLSAVGNIGASLIAMAFTELAANNLLPMSDWRCIFLFGSVPALLAYFIVRCIREPDSWVASIKEGGRKNVGSVKELFSNPLLRKHVILGMILATTGVIGAWGIGLFSLELSRKVATRITVVDTESKDYQKAKTIILEKYHSNAESGAVITPEQQKEIDTAISNQVIKIICDRWAARNLLIYNIGAVFGMYGFTLGAVFWGRRMTFTVFMTGCIVFTAATFLYMNSLVTQLLLVPAMGFFVMSMFGGYTIYFPELFPTRLRSTGVSFCYNVGRFIAAAGPLMLAGLTAMFAEFATPEDSTLPFRYAGVAMCSVFIIGIVVIWFLPETKGKPLPE